MVEKNRKSKITIINRLSATVANGFESAVAKNDIEEINRKPAAIN